MAGSLENKLTQPKDHEKKMDFILSTKYVTAKSLKVGHWLSQQKDSDGLLLSKD